MVSYLLLLIVYIVVAILISFLCSVLEAVLLSISPSYVASIRSQNPQMAKKIQGLKDKVDQPLAAILTLNTIAHTAGAAGVGAQAAYVFGDAAVGIASAIMTLLVLVFSEIIPKTLGANHWRKLAPVVASLLIWMVKLLKPFVWMSNKITKMLSKKQDDAKYLRAEIEAMATLGSQSGALNRQESELIQSLLQFKHTQIRAILTPRMQIFRIHKDMTVEAFCKEHGSMSFSRVLVYDRDPDDIIGFVLKTDVMLALHRVRDDFRISKLVKPLYTVSQTMSLPRLFRTMLERRAHISLIVDEYGEVQGIITLEDLLESLLQVNIMDEQDRMDESSLKELEKWRALYEQPEAALPSQEEVAPTLSKKEQEPS